MNNTTKWIIGIIVVVIVVLGVWWLMGGLAGQSSNTASSTLQVATTTDLETAGAQAIHAQVSSSTVLQLIGGISNGDRYASILSSTGVSLSGKGPYTVFVATDGAFSRLPAGTIDAMSSADLKRMIQYSIVSGKKLDAGAVDSGQIQALSGDTLNFLADSSGRVYVNSGYVLSAYEGSNGIVYVINSVLLPPMQAQQ